MRDIYDDGGLGDEEEAVQTKKFYRERRVQLSKPVQYGENGNISEKSVAGIAVRV